MGSKRACDLATGPRRAHGVFITAMWLCGWEVLPFAYKGVVMIIAALEIPPLPLIQL
jgi:hypothetical protein